MKNYTLLIITLFLSCHLYGQDASPLSQKVQETKSKLDKEFELIANPFVPNEAVPISIDQFSNAESAKYFDFKKNTLNQLKDIPEKAIALQIPYEHEQGSHLLLDLIEVSESFYDFSVTTSSGKKISGRDLGGKHYRGIVRGNELNSLVALSVFENELSGIISISGQGTINIGKLGQQEQHVIYNDANLRGMGDEEFCQTPDDGEQNPIVDDLYLDIYNDDAFNPEDKCLKMYFELDHEIYTYYGGSTPATANFLIGMFNEVATIYMNESITMELSEIFIWDTPDTYSSSTSTGLNQFVAQRSTFNGDLAYLLTFRPGTLDPNDTSNAGGRANYFGGVCVTGNNNLSPHSYTILFPEFVSYPVFSRQVKVITHEIGHNLGSRHTHACVWNENFTAIDGCSGFTEGDCLLPSPIPDYTGTIMSYCDRNAGIDFTLGFGPQPGNLIRSFVSSLACVDDCVAEPDCNLTTNVSTINLNASTTSSTFSVTSNGNWSVSDNASWISLNSTSGTGNGTVGFTVSANILSTPRTAVITISCTQTFITVTIVQNANPSPPPCHEIDSLALVSLYNATDGPNWTIPWNLTEPMANWNGLQFNSQGCVSELFLSDNNLVGILPPEIGNLLELTSLNLRKNQLSGFIPSEFGNLSNLTYVQLYLNQLSGSLPAEIGNLSNLTFLNLGSNDLGGSIPSTVGNLSNLTYLSIRSNKLTGSIPASIGNLSSLTSLNLDSNKLSGNIPASLGNLSNLISLQLNRNLLSGNIPSEIGNMTSLTNFTLFYNRLSGCFDQNLSNICNQLYIVNIDNGNSFDATWDNFCNTGSGQCTAVPQTCRFSDSLALVSLYNSTDGPNWTNKWNLDQPIDTWYGLTLNSVGCVNKIYLWGNGLNGTIPPELGNLSGLTSLNLIYNQLSGPFPPELGNLANLYYLGLANNQLSGCYDQNLANLCDQLVLLQNDISNLNNFDAEWGDFCNTEAGQCSMAAGCRFTDSLTLVTLYNATNGPNWSNSWNLNEPLSQWYGVTQNADGCVSYLNLRSNLLNGTIPSDLGNLSSLNYLNLSYNQLNGNVPADLSNLSNLTSIYLNRNQLGGTIPSELGALSNLTALYLNDNQFNGSIPSELGNLSQLTSLGLHNNQLSSAIPAELGNLYNLTSMNLYSNQLSGSIPCEFGNLSNVSNLNLFDNQLSGSIPPELGNLLNLRYLRLQTNQLSGSLPAELGNLPNLLYLQLYANQLSGCFEQNLLNLCNQLTTVQIGSGNTFDATWANFCTSGAGSCSSATGCRLSDSLALVTLYNATDGPNWLNSWNLNQPMNTWFGLSINSDGCVTQINLNSNQLNGVIPAEIGSLSNLTRLTLNNNQLSGNIPAEIGNLISLTNLSFNFNQLSGNIPPELGNLSMLTYLGLRTNQFSGPIPAELGNLSNVITMHLHFNQFSGEIPPQLGNLSNIQILNMYVNQLTGPIPPEFGNLPNLSYLQLHSNQLSGCFDQNLLNLCDQLSSVNINNGNNFDATWSDFCNSGSGTCTDFPTVTDFPYQEGFENGLGLWTQDANDDMDWTRKSGSTPSPNTGPTIAAEGSYYMYTEASGNSNKDATLISPHFDLSQVANPILVLKYHMYGVDMGTLVVEASTDNGITWNSIAGPTSGVAIDSWITYFISYGLDTYASEIVQLRLRGTIGNWFRSDIAVDDIKIYSNTNNDALSCPEFLSISDPILEGPYFQALDYISTNGIVLLNSDVTIKSGMTIELLTDFEVKDGAVFHALIGACQ